MAATVPAVERGQLRIADRVFTRLAARAARQALAEDAAAGSVVGGGAVTGGTVRRTAVSELHGAVRLTVGVELPFPADLAALAERVRAAVQERLTELTGRSVGEVVVVVERLVPRG
ncbi:Asp23/Gls24 family envelope stress response protein [Kitasatospora sp. NPDC096147]|uniref:Asp23/Gls24 family envelope stress response protein n=1 Tax=Kitasatospora sp. NPDC096147 TaxID=3364093 RepID=UPI00382FE36E